MKWNRLSKNWRAFRHITRAPIPTRACPTRSRRPVFRKQLRHLHPRSRNGQRTVGSTCWRLLWHNTRSHPCAGKTGASIFAPCRRSDDELHMILRLSGLEPLNITPEFGFAVIGERTNITGSPKFSKLILAGDFEGALAVPRQAVQGGANLLDVNMDEGMIDSEAAMVRFLNLIGS